MSSRAILLTIVVAFMVCAGCGSQADKQSQSEEGGGGLHIDLPGVKVDVSKKDGIGVQAPGVDVKVDDKGVGVQAPSVDVDVNEKGVDVDAFKVNVDVNEKGVEVKTPELEAKATKAGGLQLNAPAVNEPAVNANGKSKAAP